MSKYSKLYRVYIDQLLSKDQVISIDGNKFNYFKSVIRLKLGQKFRIFGKDSGEYLAEVIEFSRNELKIKLTEKIREIITEPELTLALSIIKPDKFLDAIKGSVQLGVTRIIPVVTQFSQISEINRDRVERCIIESLEQCERMIPPQLTDITNFAELLTSDLFDQIIWADEQAELANKISKLNLRYNDKIAILIGPEGGFAPAERALLLECSKALSVSLGVNVLRSETAAIAALACVQMVRS